MKDDRLNLNQMMEVFEEWMKMIRIMLYKEEYLDECN